MDSDFHNDSALHSLNNWGLMIMDYELLIPNLGSISCRAS